MTTDDRPRTIRDGLVPLGPDDTYNGVKVSSFCMECRDAMARYEHGIQANVTLCRVDSARVQENAPADPVMVPILKPNGTPMDPLMGPPMSVEQPASSQVERPTSYEDWKDCLSVAELPYAQALITAAPEMESLLRSLEHVSGEAEMGWTQPRCHFCEAFEDQPHAADCRLHVLLARLDAAKAGS